MAPCWSTSRPARLSTWRDEPTAGDRPAGNRWFSQARSALTPHRHHSPCLSVCGVTGCTYNAEEW
jgi:hypothetical protein